MKPILLIFSLLFGLSHAAAAQSRYGEKDIIEDFSIATLEKVLQQMGETYAVNSASNPAVIEMDFRQLSTKIMLRPDCGATATGKTRCPGVTLYSLFPGAADFNAVNQFNGANEYANAFLFGDDRGNPTLVLEQTIRADHGLPYGTLRGNIGLFRASLINWLKYAGPARAQ